VCVCMCLGVDMNLDARRMTGDIGDRRVEVFMKE